MQKMQESVSLSPGLGKYPGEGNGNSLQYSCPENAMDRGAWGGYIVHGVAKSWTQPSMHAHTQSITKKIPHLYLKIFRNFHHLYDKTIHLLMQNIECWR